MSRFVLSLFVPHLSLFWCIGKAMFPDSGISFESPLTFLYLSEVNLNREASYTTLCCVSRASTQFTQPVHRIFRSNK